MGKPTFSCKCVCMRENRLLNFEGMLIKDGDEIRMKYKPFFLDLGVCVGVKNTQNRETCVYVCGGPTNQHKKGKKYVCHSPVWRATFCIEQNTIASRTRFVHTTVYNHIRLAPGGGGINRLPLASDDIEYSYQYTYYTRVPWIKMEMIRMKKTLFWRICVCGGVKNTQNRETCVYVCVCGPNRPTQKREEMCAIRPYGVTFCIEKNTLHRGQGYGALSIRKNHIRLVPGGALICYHHVCQNRK